MKKNKIFLVVLMSLFCFVSLAAYAAPRAKPVVAIKEAKVGEGVSKYGKKYLNLGTLGINF